ILGEDLAKKVQFFASQGRASLATLGRNVLVHEGGPVLLVMDSDTLDPRLTAELESMNKVAMSSVRTSGAQLPVPAASSRQFKVFTFVPEIEAVFFEAPEVLGRLVGKTVSKDKVSEGHLVPKQVLAELLADTKAHQDYHLIIDHIDPQSRQSIASG